MRHSFVLLFSLLFNSDTPAALFQLALLRNGMFSLHLFNLLCCSWWYRRSATTATINKNHYADNNSNKRFLIISATIRWIRRSRYFHCRSRHCKARIGLWRCPAPPRSCLGCAPWGSAHPVSAEPVSAGVGCGAGLGTGAPCCGALVGVSTGAGAPQFVQKFIPSTEGVHIFTKNLAILIHLW